MQNSLQISADSSFDLWPFLKKLSTEVLSRNFLGNTDLVNVQPCNGVDEIDHNVYPSPIPHPLSLRLLQGQFIAQSRASCWRRKEKTGGGGREKWERERESMRDRETLSPWRHTLPHRLMFNHETFDAQCSCDRRLFSFSCSRFLPALNISSRCYRRSGDEETAGFVLVLRKSITSRFQTREKQQSCDKNGSSCRSSRVTFTDREELTDNIPC